MDRLDERKYLAVSLKHSDKFPYVLWGYKRTKDDEKRCYSDYTTDINKAELYSIEEFEKAYGNHFGVFNYSPISVRELKEKFKKLKKKYDTVFVTESEYLKAYGYWLGS